MPNTSTGAAGGPTTTSTFDLDSEAVAMTDPDSNVTKSSFDFLGNLVGTSELVALGEGSTTTATTSDICDADGNVVEAIDANNRAITYAFNSSDQETGETWYPTAADAAAGIDSDGAESFGFNLVQEMTSAANSVGGSGGNSVASYSFQRNSLGAVTAQNVLLANVSANVILSSGYDAEGHRVSLSANIGGTLAGNGTVTGGIKDFINTYTFNTRGDMTGITQTAQTGGSDNGVAAKNVVLGYNNNGQIGSIAAYASTGTGSQVYSATDSYDADLRLTDLVYSAAGGTLAGYHLDYNSNSTVADEYVRNDTSGTPGASYTSWAELTNTVDHDSQLLNTSYSSNFANPPCGSGGSGGSGTQSYDANGNRTSAAVPSYLTSDTGAGNRMLFDGTYTYAYDAAGNRILKWVNNNGVAGDGVRLELSTVVIAHDCRR